MANPFVKDLYGNQIEVTNLPAAISQAFGGIGIDNVNFSPFRITKDGLSEDIKGRENELISASKYWEHLHFHLLLLKAILARKEKISSKDTFKEVAEKYLYGLVFTEITCEIITEIEESLSSLIIVSHYDIDMEESKLITFANGKRVSDLIISSTKNEFSILRKNINKKLRKIEHHEIIDFIDCFYSHAISVLKEKTWSPSPI